MANAMVPYEEALKILEEKLGKSREEIESLIDERKAKLGDLVSREGIANIMLAELGFDPSKSKGRTKISGLLPGSTNVEVVGKVVRKFEIKEFQKENGPGHVASFIMADDTGTIRVVLWNDHAFLIDKINEGDILLINRAYVKVGSRNRKELHLSERSQIEINPNGIEIETIYEKAPSRKKISELQEGDANIEIIATIVQVLNPKVVGTCPICDSIVKVSEEGDYVCRIHGILNEKPKETYVLNAFVDDGTASARVVFWRSHVEKFLNATPDEIIEYANNPTAMQDLKTDLLAKIIRVVGNVRKNRFSGSLDINVVDFEFLDSLPSSLEKEHEDKDNKQASLQSSSYLDEDEEEDIDIEDIDI